MKSKHYFNRISIYFNVYIIDEYIDFNLVYIVFLINYMNNIEKVPGGKKGH